MKVIYVIGPFSAPNSWEMECNIRKAEEIALRLWRLGFAVICPHTNTRFFEGAFSREVVIDGDKEILKRCDGCIKLEGWEMSAGSIEEIRFAMEKGIPVFSKIMEVYKHFGGEW